jgi:hypothetical protein
MSAAEAAAVIARALGRDLAADDRQALDDLARHDPDHLAAIVRLALEHTSNAWQVVA